MSAPEAPCPGCGIGRTEVRADIRGELVEVTVPTHRLLCPQYVQPPYVAPVFD